MIKTIRLANGEDILAEINDEDEYRYYISYPMYIMLKFDAKLQKNVMIMDYWISPLTVQNLENIELMKASVMSISDTSDSLNQYYNDSIDKLRLKRLLDEKYKKESDSENHNEVYVTSETMDETELMELMFEKANSTTH